MNLKRVFLRNRNNKIYYYIKALIRELIPSAIPRATLRKRLNSIYYCEHASYINDRVNYYNKLAHYQAVGKDAIEIGQYGIPERIRVYYFDSKEYLRFFNPRMKFSILPGDIIHIPEFPSIVKSRPITGNNANSVILKLDKSRHFNFVHDDIPFDRKINILVGRSGFTQPHRARFYTLFHDHPLCNLKKANKPSDAGYLSISDHLHYKFVLALEGNDVATNLKWIMSSNSIAVMPMPKYETWFMEGRLIPDHHFICIKDDYSDLEEKLNYFITHEQDAKKIVQNANEYIKPFKNTKQEDLIALKVLEKYFRLTGQVLIR
ncbi:lipopolysaccharide biosynthesis protein [Sphingobacterium sp. InxBP1]|uniref:glycosyl transferase family 90 n=1 Tax=Sphingobacterium sp. InxBP1 TaxID=2870328 RepID=UPI0022432DCD|nr:glycosyl transferase family 90 [Sphingobacterium sp. InxBP1]MCW8312115.1 lipopolysaccharide biosynthesis protein [Sphingobacterium sp. InxBP1]